MTTPSNITIIPYDPNWTSLYQQEADAIFSALGSLAKEIYHFGSTSIPNMPAKPVIDILLVCENFDSFHDISQKLKTLHYEIIRRSVIPHRSYFTTKKTDHISFNLHIRERGDPQINRHVNFSDFLIHHPDDAKKYAELKIQLAKKFSRDMNAYVLGKYKFIQEIDAKAKHWAGRKKDFLTPNTGLPAHDWSSEKVIKAMEANLNIHMTHFAQYLSQIDLIRIPGYSLVNTGLPDDTFNYVLEAHFTDADADTKIAEIAQYFTKKNAPYSWWVCPYDQPDNLIVHLERNSYVNTENNIAMYFDLDAWHEEAFTIPELEIVQAKDKKTLQDFALILANDENSFKTYFDWIASALTDEDPIEYYVGYVNGKPVVRGLTCYFAQVAGLHWLSTLPSERQKGYGRAMQEFRLKRAKELGYHIAVLQASQQGFPLYKKIGYKECGVFKEFKLL